MDSEDPLIFRVGIFFYVIGGGAFLLFVASDLAKQADFDYPFHVTADDRHWLDVSARQSSPTLRRAFLLVKKTT